MTNESEIQRDIKGKWNRWEHSTKAHMPQSENKFLPNYVECPQTRNTCKGIEKEKPMVPTAFAVEKPKGRKK